MSCVFITLLFNNVLSDKRDATCSCSTSKSIRGERFSHFAILTTSTPFGYVSRPCSFCQKHLLPYHLRLLAVVRRGKDEVLPRLARVRERHAHFWVRHASYLPCLFGFDEKLGKLVGQRSRSTESSLHAKRNFDSLKSFVSTADRFQLSMFISTTFFFLFFSLVSLIADGPHRHHPACGHKGASYLSPVHALQFFYRDASSALLQLVNQWLNFMQRDFCHRL